MLLRVALFAALGGFLYGYDLGLIGGAILSIHDELHTSQTMEEMVVGSAKLGAVLGTFLGGGLMVCYGRRATIAMDSFFFVLGPVTMAFSSSLLGLVVGRVLVGFGIGISAVVVPAYLGELSPAALRGRIVELYEVALCIGMLCAVIADFSLENVHNNWRWMVGIPAIPGLIMSGAMWFLPESPRWLVVDGQLDAALGVIHRIYTKDKLPLGVQESTAEVEQELLELWSSVEKDKDARRQLAHATLLARQAQRARARLPKQWAKERRDGQAALLPSGPLPPLPGRVLPLEAEDGRHRAAPSKPQGDSYGQHAAATDEGIPMDPVGSPPVMGFKEQLHLRLQDVASGTERRTPLPSPWDPEGSTAAAAGDDDDLGPGLHRQLSDRASPLYRSLSEIPNGLAPIRTSSRLDQLGEDSGSAGSGPPPEPRVPKPKQPRLSGGGGRLTMPADLGHWRKPGFWNVQMGVLRDVYCVLQGPDRRAVQLMLCIAIINQGMASNSIINYAPQLLQSTHTTSSRAVLWTSFITIAKICGSAICMLLVDTTGRRTLMIQGSLGCGLALLLVGLADFLGSGLLMIMAMCAFILAFSASYAGIFWVLLSELFSMPGKAPGAALCTAVMFAAGALPDLIMMTLHSWIGAASFLIYAGVAFAGGLLCWRNLPETKGRTLAEVQALLAPKQAQQQQGTELGQESGARVPADVELGFQGDSAADPARGAPSGYLPRWQSFVPRGMFNRLLGYARFQPSDT